MQRLFLAGALVLAAAPALAQTTNDYTPAQQRRAEAAVRAAGFTPRGAPWAQADYLFFRAERNGQVHSVTVSPKGEVFPSTSVPLPAPAAR